MLPDAQVCSERKTGIPTTSLLNRDEDPDEGFATSSEDNLLIEEIIWKQQFFNELPFRLTASRDTE